MEEFVMGEENFNEGAPGFSSIIFKKDNEKIKLNKEVGVDEEAAPFIYKVISVRLKF